MKNYYFVLTVILGFLLMPGVSFACGKGSEKNSCKKEISSTKKNNDCCKIEKNCDKKSKNGCGGKCGHSKCGCPSSSNGFTSVYEINFKNNIFDFSSENQKYFHSETFISSGFFSLWLIPKIS